MPFAHLVVIRVMGGRDFHASRSKTAIHVAIGDDLNTAINERKGDVFAHKVGVAFIFGVYHDCCVPKVRFRARGGYDDVFLGIFKKIAQVVQLALVLLVLYLNVAQCSIVGTPVDHVIATDD